MTKSNSILHRAAALLAALCLLASMALPVYAAETETEFSVSSSETIPGDDNTGNGADGTGSDISVSNLETIQKDADTTNEGSKTEPEISVPESGTIPSGADTTDKAAGAPLAEGVTGSENTAPADNAAADKTADTDKTGEDSTGGEDEAGFSNEDDSADDRMITAGNAKESDIALCADDTTVQEGTKYTFYFAPPTSWIAQLNNGSTITCSFKRGNSDSMSDEPTNGVRETTAKRTDDSTKDGRTIYQVDVYHNQGKETSLCPYGGFVWVKFALDKDHWVTMKGQFKGNTDYWMEVGDIADKCLDGKQLAENQEYAYDLSKWVPYADITPKHVRYGKQTMTLLNKSAQALDSVTVTFWEKGADEKFTPVGDSQSTGVLQTGDKADITIPEAACAYVSFQKADNTYIGKQYFNFYNDEDPSDNIAVFPYDPDTRYCLIYTGDNDVRWSAPGSKTVYFDATFSDMSYNNDNAKITYGMPDANGNLWCYITSDNSSKPAITSQMARDRTSEIWYADVPQGYTQIRFASWAVDGTNTANNGTDTALLTIPDLSKPCFYADTSDDVIYQGGNRGGYWDELGATRDAEKGKKAADESAKSIVDLESKDFTPQPNTKYISTTLYDYYTDYELNGNNRNTYSSNEVNKQRSYVTFEQFDRALSNYYKQYADINKKPINYPLYTGHFQPNIWDNAFSRIASNLNLYGWSTTENDTYWRFIAVNNSAHALDDNHSEGHYKDTFQGLVGNQMVNGMPVMAGTNLAEPHFNEAFLTGTNTEKAVLGKVYKDVSFPFTQKPVFTQTEGDLESKAQYWYFDSNERSLYLKQDTANTSKYYLEAKDSGKKDKSGNPIYTDDNSQNRGSDNSTEDNKNNNQPRGFGFFPFNQKMGTENRNVNKYNYGFGAKLQFDFTLTDDGQVVVGTDEKGKDIKVPIKFFFSGDDDVWVYIDNQLVLDVGGAHSKASGLLEFGRTTDGTANTVIPYVSSNKAGGATYTTNANNKTVYFNGKEVKFEKQGKIVDKDDQTKEFTLDKGTTHTLTMFYMERGMWESNMAVAFNFPDHNELQVEKQVDLRDVDTAFQACFNDQKIFDFTIQNLATHYGTKEAVQPGTGGVKSKMLNLTADADVESIHPATTGSEDYIFALAPDPVQGSETNTGQVLHWFAPYNDLSSTSRDKRYGILKLNKPIDLNQYGYLTFEIYVKGETNLSLNNLYLQLLDDGNRQMGSLNKAGLNGATFGSVTLVPNQWNTVKLSLNKMNAVDGFDNKVTTIRVGDNYQRDIYFRNFTFVPKTVPDIKTGFTTEQDKIPDYGSATTGTLKNATYAKYTSNFDGMQVVDDQGRFVLENNETITFNDQFRRGSYISLKEILNPDLYETKWTVYENGLPVTSMKGDGVNTVTVEDQNKSLENQTTSGPDDGRTEKQETKQSDNKYGGTKPTDANTIVFRSYSNPDESGDSLTRLKVQYINKVKTGGLIIKKEAAAGEPLTGTYTFKVTFSDVGGQGLEPGDPIVKRYTINMGDGNADHTVPITGIPVGTRYTIEEEAPKDGSHLQGVTLTGNERNAHVVNNTTVEGVIVESTNQKMTATFTNTKRTLIDIAFTKVWQDAVGKPLSSKKLPEKIYIQLQRRLENSTNANDWKAVEYPATGSANYVIVTPTNGGWQCSFTGLDQHELNGNTNYVYRIVEGTLGTDGTFTAKDSSITIGGNTYTISAAATLTGTTSSTANGTITGGSGEIVLTNTLQDPKFTLNIVKKGVTTGENGTEVQTPLGGVEFKLERLTVPSGGGEPQVDTTYEFGSGKTGSITGTTGNDGQITDNPFKNLKPGSYQLTEVKTAEGYNLLSKPIRIEFNTKGECYIDRVKDETNVTRTGDTCTMTLTVLNRKSFELPHTGADAPSLWLLIGLPALVAVLLVLVFRYNKKGGRRQ